MENFSFYFYSKKNPSELLVEQRAKLKEQRAKSNEQRAKSNEHRAKSNEQRAKSNEPQAKTNEQRARRKKFHFVLVLPSLTFTKEVPCGLNPNFLVYRIQLICMHWKSVAGEM